MGTVTASQVWPVVYQGLALCLGLIVAFGPQNCFVLRQGLRSEHVGPVVLLCWLSDLVLIAAGVFGMAQAFNNTSQDLARGLALAGAAFLAVYGWQALRRALHPKQLHAGASGERLCRRAAMAQAAAITLLNPHTYLDTMLLIGGIGAQQQDGLQGWFVAGASSASLCWFVALGFGARWLAPLFSRPGAWQVLDGLSALTMWVLFAQLVWQALQV
jgi:L-lysine exporter family protein LysE/ArgO